MTLTLPPREIEMILLPLVIAAALYDLKYRRIPNWLNVTGVVLGFAMNAWLHMGGSPLSGLLFALKGMALGFGAYFLLYALRAMGAGDVKLMAAVGAIVGWEDWVGIFILTAILGGISALVLSVMRGRLKNTLFNVGFILTEFKSGRPAYLKREELDVKSSKALRQPHGVVIAVGTFAYLTIAACFTP
ncbi:MAG TPA: A24 family peptidase [Candidatus Sulfopaludibacter sp.]|jgi:prepilin peptidase CpaA|nr:A24 family peptidase [Candidatus Sulfopaludibacter sp.]